MFKSKTFLGLVVLAMIAASLWVVAPAAAAGPAAVQISVRAQDTNSGQVVIDSVTAPADGWLLIRTDANGTPGAMIGFAPVHQGVNQNLKVDLRSPRSGHSDQVTPTLWATYAADPNAANPNTAPDGSLNTWMGGPAVAFSSTAAGGAPVAPAASTAPAAQAGQLPTTGGASAPSAPAAAQISVHAQDTNSGLITVDSVTAPADGWLIIREDANGTPGAMIGFAPVHQGLNQGVTVALRSPRSGHSTEVTPTLWATYAADPNAANPLTAPGSTLAQFTGGPAVAFSSTAAGGAPAAPAASTAPAAQAGQLPTTGGASAPSAPAAAQISVHAQDTNSGLITVDSVTAPADGWLLIRTDANGTPGALIGFAPVHQGVNKGVTVALRSPRAGHVTEVTPTLWATYAADPNAANPLTAPGSTLAQFTGGPAVAFSSTAVH